MSTHNISFHGEIKKNIFQKLHLSGAMVREIHVGSYQGLSILVHMQGDLRYYCVHMT